LPERRSPERRGTRRRWRAPVHLEDRASRKPRAHPGPWPWPPPPGNRGGPAGPCPWTPSGPRLPRAPRGARPRGGPRRPRGARSPAAASPGRGAAGPGSPRTFASPRRRGGAVRPPDPGHPAAAWSVPRCGAPPPLGFGRGPRPDGSPGTSVPAASGPARPRWSHQAPAAVQAKASHGPGSANTGPGGPGGTACRTAT